MSDWEDPAWEGRLRVTFSYPSHGWVLMALLVDAFNQSCVIHCSNVFPPFGDMLVWLHQVADDNLPAEFFIDEEGVGKRLSVAPVSSKDFIEFLIVGVAYEEEQILRCRLNRKEMLQEFVFGLREWLKREYSQEGFSTNSDLRELDFEPLLAKINAL